MIYAVEVGRVHMLTCEYASGGVIQKTGEVILKRLGRHEPGPIIVNQGVHSGKINGVLFFGGVWKTKNGGKLIDNSQALKRFRTYEEEKQLLTNLSERTALLTTDKKCGRATARERQSSLSP